MFGRDHTDLKLREVELADRLAELQTSEALKSAIVDHAFAALVRPTRRAASSSSTRPPRRCSAARAPTSLGLRGERGDDPDALPRRARRRHAAHARRRPGAHAGQARSRCTRCAPTAASSRWRWCCGAPRRAARVFYTASIADLSERHDAARADRAPARGAAPEREADRDGQPAGRRRARAEQPARHRHGPRQPARGEVRGPSRAARRRASASARPPSAAAASSAPSSTWRAAGRRSAAPVALERDGAARPSTCCSYGYRTPRHRARPGARPTACRRSWPTATRSARS